MPANRKAFTLQVRKDGRLNRFRYENVQASRPDGHSAVSQPHELLSKFVIVPKWDTGEHVKTYTSALAKSLHEDSCHLHVEVPSIHGEQTSSSASLKRGKTGRGGKVGKKIEWTVPVAHVHPSTGELVEVQKGSCVFVPVQETEANRPLTSARDRACGVQYDVHYVVDILKTNTKLVCGFTGNASHTLHLTKPFDLSNLNHQLEQAFGASLVSCSIQKDRVAFVSRLQGFCVWRTSTASEALGFRPHATYESEFDSNAKVYVLKAPNRPIAAASSLSSKADTVFADAIRTETLLRLVPRNAISRYIEAATSNSSATHSSNPEQTLHNTGRTFPLSNVVPMRHIYSKDDQVFANMSSYQRFAVEFLSPARRQRGVVLYHDMGSGKSRTSIEIAQAHVEARFWAHCGASKDRQRSRIGQSGAALQGGAHSR